MTKKSWTTRYKKASRERRTTADGEFFASLAEKKFYERRLDEQRKGFIRDLQRQVKYPLILPNGVPILTPKGKTAKYTADFVFTDSESGKEVIAEVKGFMTEAARLRISVFEAIYQKSVTIFQA